MAEELIKPDPIKESDKTRSTIKGKPINRASDLIESLKSLRFSLKKMTSFSVTLETTLKMEPLDKSSSEILMGLVKETQGEIFNLTQNISVIRKTLSISLESHRRANPTKIIKVNLKEGQLISFKGKYYGDSKKRLSEVELNATVDQEGGKDPV